MQGEDVATGSATPEARRSGPWRGRLAGALVALALTAIPFLVVTFPPAADLPQHLAQIRLLEEVLGLSPVTTEVDQMRVLWASPNTLVYLPLFALVQVLGPVAGGRVTLALLALAWVGAVHVVAARRQRPLAAAWLAGLLVFSQSLYWGFLNFLCGVPLFLLLVDRASRPVPRGSGLRDAVAVGGLALLTYLGHSLLLAAGAASVVLFALARRDGPRDLAVRVAALVPTVLAALAWFPTLSAMRQAGGFDLGVQWGLAPWYRLASPWLLDAFFGGLFGPLEAVAALGLLAYAVLAVLTPDPVTDGRADRALLALGGGLLLVVLVGPAKWVNTIQLADRFAPLAGTLLLLGLPRPRVSPRALRAGVLGLVAAFTLITAASWTRFERVELSGLRDSLGVTSSPGRVLGLDFARQSAIVKGRPFVQLFAWPQAVHGGMGNFSFAEHASSIVAYRRPRQLTWTRALEWYPELVTAHDLTQFDHALVVGGSEPQGQFGTFAGVGPLVSHGHVRLYRLPVSGTAP